MAERLGTTVSQVHGVATFYTLFYTKPQGRHIVRLCDSPPCHIEGSKKVREAIAKELGISAGRDHRRRQLHIRDRELHGAVRRCPGRLWSTMTSTATSLLR